MSDCPPGYFRNSRTGQCDSFSVGKPPPDSEIRYSVISWAQGFTVVLIGLAAGAGWRAWSTRK